MLLQGQAKFDFEIAFDSRDLSFRQQFAKVVAPRCWQIQYAGIVPDIVAVGPQDFLQIDDFLSVFEYPLLKHFVLLKVDIVSVVEFGWEQVLLAARVLVKWIFLNFYLRLVRSDLNGGFGESGRD